MHHILSRKIREIFGKGTRIFDELSTQELIEEFIFCKLKYEENNCTEISDEEYLNIFLDETLTLEEMIYDDLKIPNWEIHKNFILNELKKLNLFLNNSLDENLIDNNNG